MVWAKAVEWKMRNLSCALTNLWMETELRVGWSTSFHLLATAAESPSCSCTSVYGKPRSGNKISNSRWFCASLVEPRVIPLYSDIAVFVLCVSMELICLLTNKPFLFCLQNYRTSWAGRDPPGASRSNSWPCSGQPLESQPVPESTVQRLLELLSCSSSQPPSGWKTFS